MSEIKNWCIPVKKPQRYWWSVKEPFPAWSKVEHCHGLAVCGSSESLLRGLRNLSTAIIPMAQGQKCVIRKENADA
jgi:hypothetical protein